MQTCGDESALQLFQGDRFIYISSQIHTSALRSGILRQGLVTFVYNFNFQHLLK
jgi:hypothetical protein